MSQDFPNQLAELALAGDAITQDQALRILTDQSIPTMDLVHAASRVRRQYFGMSVQVHILNNAQNGNCPEDCSYCAQALTSEADIESYPIKSDEEVFEEARRAHEAGAHRYCMVFAGRGPNSGRTDKLASLVREIKKRYPLEVCVSAGLLDDGKAKQLKDAGLDRYNHNLNTSRSNYPNICTTHTYDDRVSTLTSARSVGLDVCSGVIVGMGETHAEIIELAQTLRKHNAQSIPVNFFLPIEGTQLTKRQEQYNDAANALTPDFCLRVLCLFRFINPDVEVRMAAGREYHFRSMQVMGLYVANSIFLDGYLNGRGLERRETYQMLTDAGFTIESEHGLGDLLGELPADIDPQSRASITVGGQKPALKGTEELRPTLS